MKKKIKSVLMTGVLLTGMLAFAGCGGGEEKNDKEKETKESKNEYVENKYITSTNSLNLSSNFSCHDPSIVKDENTGKYYIFGSHLAQGTSEDLKSWKPLGKQGYDNSSIYGVLKDGLAGSFEWAGYNDSDCKNGYAVWAPDVIYNEHYVWEDGSKGAYMNYYSASSTYCRSCIGFAVSKNIESGYEYVDTVIYSGFTPVEAYDKDSTHNKHVENTNVYEVCGVNDVASLNPDYFKGNEYNTSQFPNAIDPTLFFDKEGKLWMTYGSWSGGIWIIEIDKETGLPIHDEELKKEGNEYSDKYFGKRIAYGKTLSGEGPFIEYDSETGYYWLFTSIGWLASDGGYNIRMFRSENPDGPYVDAAGKSGTAMGNDNASVGVKVMGGYDFPSLSTGYLSPGHNSFLIEDGKYYLVYHTRYEARDEAHSVRVHQMFLNEDKWLCAMPFQYNDEKISEKGYEKSELKGIYNVVDHDRTTNKTATQSAKYIFKEDGSISPDWQPEQSLGTWSIKEGTPYITIDLFATEYKGVVCSMIDEAGNQVMAISAIADNNKTMWAVMYK